ncbi:DUF4303 domain-containing protein [Flavobacterium sharifuzzamanii]|uniref:DUF4303 domain-containing protein n=1 Tax=Flavobacterium sharifuzzamanii TaxID=2211133 RepID=UPI000DAECCB4|nr:DUF4303 domain-containing protein [Flavobacterium sharifuzzamanii]KAF2079410.1 DUF4303 domain-containing protein [Flavobacterium sharifuzzamanii]
MDRIKLKKQLIDFTIQGVAEFLKNNSSLEFYAFAYDCNAEYAEVNLSFNTMEDFNETLKDYQNGRFSENYKTDEAIKNLKYNTGDWEYLCFDSINVLTEEELNKIYNDFPDDDYKSWNIFVEELMELFCESLIEFRNSKVYRSIPKSKDFISFCIDHDEDFEDAEKRLERVENKKSENQ